MLAFPSESHLCSEVTDSQFLSRIHFEFISSNHPVDASPVSNSAPWRVNTARTRYVTASRQHGFALSKIRDIATRPGGACLTRHPATFLPAGATDQCMHLGRQTMYVLLPDTTTHRMRYCQRVRERMSWTASRVRSALPISNKLPRAAGNGTRWRRSEAISMPSVGSRTPAGPAPIPRTASVGGWHAVHANGRASFQQVAIDQDAQD